MADQYRPPQPLSFEGDLSANWKLWKQKFELFLTASGKNNKDDNVKVAILLNLLGDEGIRIYNTFEYLDNEDKNKIEVVLNKFETYCTPTRNMVYEHFKFFKREQLPNENIDHFITALKQLASTCDFKERDILIRDRIVLGINDRRIQEKLLQKPNLELSEAVNICRSMETSVATQKEITGEAVSVDVVSKHRSSWSNRGVPGDQSYVGGSGTQGSRSSYKSGPAGRANYQGNKGHTTGNFGNCTRCGQQHERGKCPAYNKICSFCKLKGHFRKFCFKNNSVNEILDDSNRQDGGSSGEFSDFNINTVELDSDSKEIVWTINTSDVNAIEWFENINIAGLIISLKVDTGSQVNTLNIGDFNKLKIPLNRLTPVSSLLSSYSGHKIDVIGQLYLDCSYKNKLKRLLFYVLNSDNPTSIIGLSATRDLGIINEKPNESIYSIDSSSIHKILCDYQSVFAGIGKVNKQFKITLNENAIPSACPPRKIPYALKSKVKQKLNQMIAEKLIVPVTEPTDWVHPIVVVPKSNGDIRICMDPRNLNKYVKRELFEIPTCDTLFAQLSGAKFFTKLDASSAFLQLPLDYESSLLCTINTTFGRFRYLRLPYGLCSSPEIFQCFVHHMLKDLDGVIAYFDDILIFGRTVEEHNKNLKMALSKIKDSGMTLNMRKSKFCVNKIKFLGHEISSEGISPDKNKTNAISSMSPPQNKKDLQRFLGMVVYLGKFIPNLSQETAGLRRLLSNRVDWQWTQNEEKCFNRLKRLVTSNVTLSYFDAKKPITLSVDASPYGIGTVILQENKPIEFASVSLTPTQQKYNHIEKELLALVFGCERFHYYLYGHKFTIQTDHRPLIGLLRKPLDDMSPRIQRLAIRLLRYQFELIYVPGKDLKIPDTLSRDPVSDVIQTDYLETNLRVFSILATTEENEARLIRAVEEDAALQRVKYYAINGWPHHKSNVGSDVKQYWSIRHDIFVHKNVLFYKKRLLIPESLRAEFLELIHQTHQGVVSCKKRAQESIYYPGIMSDIEKTVLSCATCQMYGRTNQKEPLTPHKPPELPWEKIGIDFMMLGQFDFLVIVDYYSKFAVVNKLSSKTAASVISSLKNVFAMYGIPLEIFSDNGPPFNSREIHDFAKRYHITLKTSSPHYPRSNGMVERTIQTVKGLLYKAMENKEDPFLAILNYNSTPKQQLPAPSMLLMGRRLRSTIPVHKDTLHPAYKIPKFKNMVENKQDLQRKYYNRSTKKLPELQSGQSVYMQNKIRDWKPGVIVRKNEFNDYIVNVDNAEYRRNRQALKPIVETSPVRKRESKYHLPSPVPESSPEESGSSVPSDVRDCGDLLIKTRSGRIVKPPERLMYS